MVQNMTIFLWLNCDGWIKKRKTKSWSDWGLEKRCVRDFEDLKGWKLIHKGVRMAQSPCISISWVIIYIYKQPTESLPQFWHKVRKFIKRFRISTDIFLFSSHFSIKEKDKKCLKRYQVLGQIPTLSKLRRFVFQP